MKQILCFLLLFAAMSSLRAQDTLKLGKSYPLKKAKVVFPHSWDNTIVLPVEYEHFDRRVVTPFKQTHFCEYGLDFIDGVTPAAYSMCDSIDVDTTPGNVYLSSFTDTIRFDAKKLKGYKPSIKSKGKSYYFSSYEVVGVYKGVRTIYHCYNLVNGEVFTMWQEAYKTPAEYEELKNTTFLLRGLYYRKGDSTYKLEREFVVLFY